VAGRAASQAVRLSGPPLAEEPRHNVAYAKFAAQLKELATASPSLMDWLRQVPALSLPLGEAVASLDQAAQDLLSQCLGSSRSDRAPLGNGRDGSLPASQYQPHLVRATVIDERNGAGIDRSAV
jgi:hypothetical protein